MIGVVLWSDPAARKAVIWCEDHGDLAFFSAASDTRSASAICPDAGDLVEFDLTTEKSLRLAHNPHVVSEQMYPDLAGSLDPAKVAKPAAQTNTERRILPFAPKKSALRLREAQMPLPVGV